MFLYTRKKSSDFDLIQRFTNNFFFPSTRGEKNIEIEFYSLSKITPFEEVFFFPFLFSGQARLLSNDKRLLKIFPQE